MQIKLTDKQVEKLLDYYGNEFKDMYHENQKYKLMNLYLSTVNISNNYLNIEVNIELFLKWHIEYLYENEEVILEIPTVRLIRGSKHETTVEYSKFQEVLQTLDSDIYQINELLEVIK